MKRPRTAGGPVGSRHCQQLNGEFIAALLRDFRHGGPKAIERVRRTQPAAYLKILALLCPRENKVEHSNSLKNWTDDVRKCVSGRGYDAADQRCRPIVGGAVPRDWSGDWSVSEYQKTYCIDREFVRSAKQHKNSSEQWISYILTTGGNWAGPISEFRLVVDKGDPSNLVSFCADGVKKISPTEFEVRKKNFKPSK